MQIGEVPQRPETPARIAYGALHFSLFPTCPWIAGFRIKAIFASKGEKARQETNQPAIVFGNGGRQIIVSDFTCDAAKSREGMQVAAHKGLESLTVGELQIQHPAVSLDQGEGVELALVASIIERAEVAPIDLETLTRRWLHAQKGPLGC